MKLLVFASETTIKTNVVNDNRKSYESVKPKDMAGKLRSYPITRKPKPAFDTWNLRIVSSVLYQLSYRVSPGSLIK